MINLGLWQGILRMESKLFAAIDIGTNSTRYLVGTRDSQNNENFIDYGGKTTRIGKGLRRGHPLNEQSAEQTVNYLKQIHIRLMELNIDHLSIVATNALRECSNPENFLAQVEEIFNVAPQVISGSDEALFSYLGCSPLINHFPCVIIDIGGGSTELIYKKTINSSISHFSLPIGCVRFFEEFFHHNPNKQNQIQQMKTKTQSLVPNSLKEYLVHANQIICTAGTATTLASMHLECAQYDKNKVHGLELTKDITLSWVEKLSKISIADRKNIIGLEQSRSDIILPGLLILVQLLSMATQTEKIVISDQGLLYGILRQKWK